MVLPINGRIVIIDDKYNEALPLINILSKKRIPFNYYSGENIKDFPLDSENNKIRILFLDLNIVESQKSIKTVISTLDPIIKAIVPDNPNPYLLIIWSKKKDEFGTALEEHIHSQLPNKIPAKIAFLHKVNYFNYEGGEWHPQERCIEKIESDLNEELNNISLLRNLITWENIVHNKSSETISEFSSFFPFNTDWDRNSKAIIYRLAKAIIGNDDLVAHNDKQKLVKAFININSFLSDKIENEVEELTQWNITDVSDTDIQIPPAIISEINSKIHISFKHFSINNFDQGNIYFLPNQDNLIERILWDKKFKPAKRTQLFDSEPQLVQLDLTPVCDYSQNKEYVRTIFGVVLHNTFYSDCENKGLIYYQTPIFRINEQEKFLLFDFRFIKTVIRTEIIERNIPPNFKLRKEICTDIQSQLANQINRPGISNV